MKLFPVTGVPRALAAYKNQEVKNIRNYFKIQLQNNKAVL